MRGISEERLREILSTYSVDSAAALHMDWLIRNECQELNPWLPIESAPKDRPIILFNPADNRGYSGEWRITMDGKSGYWDYDSDFASTDEPTNWAPMSPNPELPEPTNERYL